ncbi:MAG TPA: DegV family protein [Anaerolineae bacterium]
MAQVKIVTDSNAYFTDPDLVSRLGIEIVPLVIRIGQHSYQEGVNLSTDASLRKLAQDASNVSVEAPTVTDYAAFLRRVSRSSDRIVCIHLSTSLNDVAEVARRAANTMLGRQRIVVLDTATTSAGLGLIVEAAAQAAVRGEEAGEIERIVRGMIPHMYALFFSDSLHYLESWGRLGAAQAMLGTMLGLKPLATMEDGDLLPIEKVRNYGHAVDKLHDFIIEFPRIEQLFVLQHDFEAEAAQLLERLEIIYPQRQFPVIDYPPSLAVHLGPKALGVIVYEGTR